MTLELQANDFRTTRLNLVEALKKDLLGPYEEREEVDVNPYIKYKVGVLFPSGTPEDQLEEIEDQLEDEIGDDEEDFPTDVMSTKDDFLRPSSIGMTCAVDSSVKEIAASVTFAIYKKNKQSKKKAWLREPITFSDLVINLVKKEATIQLCEGIDVCVYTRTQGETISLSVFLVNRKKVTAFPDTEDCIFQPEIVLTGIEDGSRPFISRKNLEPGLWTDDERAINELLYRNKHDFGIGHGCAVTWEEDLGNTAGVLRTSLIPMFEVPATEHYELPDCDGLDMKVLAEVNSPFELEKLLNPIVREYEKWINDKEQLINTLPIELQDTARSNIRLCRESSSRINDGIKLLVSKDGERYFQAFKFANQVMLLQRVQTQISRHYRIHGTRPVLTGLKGRWRLFQIAFILMNLCGVSDSNHPDRSIVDLLWFPTGGGKTEAYLGLTAYIIALRRYGNSSSIENYAGVTVLMRYTLRLLTTQQFQRATSLICACEYIRRKDPVTWGDEPIRIGLWVGRDSTPNTREQAEEALKKLADGETVTVCNPIQLNYCPWCGEKLEVKDYALDQDRGLEIYCPNTGCEFHDAPIPALTVDQDIYRWCPTLLLSTVDKLARLPWTGKVGSLFGNINRFCERHGFFRDTESHSNSHRGTGLMPGVVVKNLDGLAPPSLIIQDELHLIAGPLGTMVGLYETAINYLSSLREEPKIIASTATIRNAQQQVFNLFTKEVKQFPAPGLESGDSFFAREKSLSDVPGRLYVGINAPGVSGKTSRVRIYSILLQEAKKLETSEYIDPYWTLVGYFNSIKELAATLRLIEDDIPERQKQLVKAYGGKRRGLFWRELTSRVKASNIPVVLAELEKQLGNNPIDILIATNMISVGVDIDRLGLMVVNGQPKTSAEYIQSTSRVGRQFPGVIFTLYNWSRPRDISHYERFWSYHSMLYRFVEATSVTPFSPRARDKGLPAIVIGLARQLESEIQENKNAKQFKSSLDVCNIIRMIIAERAQKLGCSELEVGAEVEALFKKWNDRARTAEESGLELYYEKQHWDNANINRLLKHAGENYKDAMLVPDSLREVEAEVVITSRE